MEMRSAVTGKIHGVPVWVIGVVLGGAILAYMYVRRSGASDPSGSGSAPGDNANADQTGQDGTGADSTSDTLPSWTTGADGGFNNALPPAAPPATGRLDPAILRQLKAIHELEQKEQRERRKKKKHKKSGGGHPAGVTNPAQHNPQPGGRHANTHFVGGIR